MAFRLNVNVDQWFNNLGPKNDKALKTKFDLFYLCLLIGLADGKPETLKGAPDFQDTFVSEYHGSQNIIIGLLILAELGRQGVDTEEKEAVQRILDNIIDSNRISRLSDEGERKLNEYTNRGFEIMSQEISSKPYNEADFLRHYLNVATKIIDNSDLCKKYS